MARLSKLILILGMVVVNSAHAFSMKPQMSCGTYQVSGWLRFNSRGHAVIRIQEGTSSQYELLLIHPDLGQLLLYRDTMISAEVYVGREITSNQKPFVIFKRWLSKFLPADNAVQFVRNGDCYKI